MYSILLILVAVAGAGVVLYGAWVWSRTRSTLLLFCLASLLAAVLEALWGGIGHRLGPGRQLLDLYALPLLLATFAWPLSLYTMATLSRRLGHPWARIDWGHGAVCLLAAALLVYGLPGLLRLQALVPGCWEEIVWYARSVPAALACPGSDAGAATAAGFPLVLTCVLAGWGALGFEIWRHERQPWLLAAVLAGSGLLLLPAGWGPVPGAVGLALTFTAVVAEVVRRVPVLVAIPAGESSEGGLR